MSDQTREPSPEYQLQNVDVSPDQGGLAPGSANGQTLGTQECPNCGAENHTAATICHACGEYLHQRPKNIRCRQCGQRTTSNLTICPHCGRELHAAPSRLWTWVVPAALGLLFLIFLLSRLDGGPIGWTKDQLDRSASWISGIGDEMAPDILVQMTPVTEPAVEEGAEGAAAAAEDSTAVESETASIDESGSADSGSSDGGNADGGENAANADIAVALAPTETPMSEPTATATAEPTEAPAEEPTQSPTSTATADATKKATPTASATTEPTATATSSPTENEAAVILQPTAASVALVPTSTPTPTLQDYSIRAGDTLSSIAARFDVTVDVLMAANDIAPGEVYTLRVGEVLVVPPSDGQGGPATQTYTVRAGDTFLAIASRFDLTVDTLQSANGLTDDEVRLLRPGQALTIPTDDSTASTAPAAQRAPATATTAATSAPPTATPAPAPTEPVLRLDAPRLRSPENNAFVSCQGSDQLAWEGVNFILPSDEYVLHLGFVNGVDGTSSEEIVWVLNQMRPPSRTSWEIDNDLCGLAPQEFGRQWRWYVDVIDEASETVSLPSETWGFSWN